MSFITEFKRLQRQAHKINVSKGFNETEVAISAHEQELRDMGLYDAVIAARTSQKLMLMVDELSEGHEGERKDNGPDSHIPKFSSLEAELADVVIRVMNFATDRKLRLAEAIIAKMVYNRNRPYKHGGKKF